MSGGGWGGPQMGAVHDMQEASDAATLVAKGCMGPIERQRLLRWDERLRITQSSLGTQAGFTSP